MSELIPNPLAEPGPPMGPPGPAAHDPGGMYHPGIVIRYDAATDPSGPLDDPGSPEEPEDPETVDAEDPEATPGGGAVGRNRGVLAGLGGGLFALTWACLRCPPIVIPRLWALVVVLSVVILGAGALRRGRASRCCAGGDLRGSDGEHFDPGLAGPRTRRKRRRIRPPGRRRRLAPGRRPPTRRRARTRRRRGAASSRSGRRAVDPVGAAPPPANRVAEAGPSNPAAAGAISSRADAPAGQPRVRSGPSAAGQSDGPYSPRRLVGCAGPVRAPSTLPAAGESERRPPDRRLTPRDSIRDVRPRPAPRLQAHRLPPRRPRLAAPASPAGGDQPIEPGPPACHRGRETGRRRRWSRRSIRRSCRARPSRRIPGIKRSGTGPAPDRCARPAPVLRRSRRCPHPEPVHRRFRPRTCRRSPGRRSSRAADSAAGDGLLGAGRVDEESHDRSPIRPRHRRRSRPRPRRPNSLGLRPTGQPEVTTPALPPPTRPDDIPVGPAKPAVEPEAFGAEPPGPTPSGGETMPRLRPT